DYGQNRRDFIIRARGIPTRLASLVGVGCTRTPRFPRVFSRLGRLGGLEVWWSGAEDPLIREPEAGPPGPLESSPVGVPEPVGLAPGLGRLDRVEAKAGGRPRGQNLVAGIGVAPQERAQPLRGPLGLVWSSLLARGRGHGLVGLGVHGAEPTDAEQLRG